MAFMKQDAISFSMATLGWLCAIVSCVLPIWRVTSPDDETNPDASIWEGLWHMCQVQGNRWIQCTWYDTQLPVTLDLKVSRVLTVLCIIGTWLGLLLCMAGTRRINYLINRRIEDKAMKLAGGMFLRVGFPMLISLTWVTYTTTHGFFNPLLGCSKKAEMGASLYLAWTSSLLLLVGGILFWVNLPSCSGLPHCIVGPGDRPSGAISKTSDVSWATHSFLEQVGTLESFLKRPLSRF